MSGGIPRGIESPIAARSCPRCGGVLEHREALRLTCTWCRAAGAPREQTQIVGPGLRCAACGWCLPEAAVSQRHESAPSHRPPLSRQAPGFSSSPIRLPEGGNDGAGAERAPDPAPGEPAVPSAAGPVRPGLVTIEFVVDVASPPRRNPADAEILRMLEAGASYREIARDLRAGRSRIARLKRNLDRVDDSESPAPGDSTRA